MISRPREELTDNAQERLQALVDSTDGFELAEKDLELRGEGQLLGTRQSGLSELRFTGSGPTARCSSAREPQPRVSSTTKGRSPTRWSGSSASAISRPEQGHDPGSDPGTCLPR